MKFTVSEFSSVPEGTYNATFDGVEPFSENTEKYGEGVLLKFKITNGEHEGEAASRICSRKFSPKSNLFKFAKAIKGRDLKPGDEFDFADFVGTSGMAIVEKTESGESTRVATFLRSAE